MGGLNYFEYFPLHFKFIIDFSLSYVYMDTFLYLPDLTLTIFNFVGGEGADVTVGIQYLIMFWAVIL